MRILVQGFGPFGRFPINPSELLVRALGTRTARPNGHELHTTVLETTAERVAEAVPALMAEHRPDVWLGVGLAAGRPSLSVEAVAVNLGRWDAEEASGLPCHAISEQGPAAYLTTLPTEAILGAWRDADIPGYLSHTAGTYLCNMSFYLAAQAAHRLGAGCRVGFLHVPLLPSQIEKPASEPSMSFALQQAGLDTVLDVCRATQPAGTTGPAGHHTSHSDHPTSDESPVSTGRTG